MTIANFVFVFFGISTKENCNLLSGDMHPKEIFIVTAGSHLIGTDVG